MLHRAVNLYRGEITVKDSLADSHASGGFGLAMLETLFNLCN